MVMVKPKELVFATQLAQIRNQAGKTVGRRSRCLQYSLKYQGGGVLTVTSTDNRLVLVSRLPVAEHRESWEGTIDSRRLDCIRHLNGGSFEIGVKGRRLCLDKGNQHLRFPLTNQTPVTEPFLASLEQLHGISATIPYSTIREPLRFLTLGSTKSKSENLSQVLTIFTDGLAMTNLSGVNLAMEATALPFCLQLYREEAKKVLQWGQLILGRYRSKDMSIEITSLPVSQGRHYFRFCIPAYNHVLYCPACRAPYPRQGIDLIRAAPPLASCLADRQLLLQLANLVRARSRHQRLTCRLLGNATGEWELHLSEQMTSDDCQGSELRLPVKPAGTQESQAAEHRFDVGARNLSRSLRRLDSVQVRLTLLPAIGYLGVEQSGTGSEGSRCKAFLKISDYHTDT